MPPTQAVGNGPAELANLASPARQPRVPALFQAQAPAAQDVEVRLGRAEVRPALAQGGQVRSCACGICRLCAAQAYARQGGGAGGGGPATGSPGGAAGASDQTGTAAEAAGSGDTAAVAAQDQVLTAREQLAVASLRRRDTEVKAHERAHLAAAGGYATSSAHYQRVRGPDGRYYAVGGEVGIDTSAEGSPQRTIAKMLTIRRAALAPANPSAQDRRVAALAGQRLMTAYGELDALRREEQAARQEAIQARGAGQSAEDGAGGVETGQEGSETPAPAGAPRPSPGLPPAGSQARGLGSFSRIV
ncbi:MAG: putative metalloprotease CJM1_0395 family protein [Thermodesulfobacteriota bacterium]